MAEKKSWSKPVCEKVKLAAEEAVITGCKVKGSFGPGVTACGAKAACLRKSS
jgi:hypothetical protein